MRRPAIHIPLACLFTLACLIALAGAAGATAVSWINAAGGPWATAANWSPAIVPGAGDDVLLDLPGTYTINATGTINLQSLTVGAASGTQTLAGTATITIGTASGVAGGTSGAVLRAITLSGAGSFTVPAGTTLTLQTCTVNAALVNEGTLVLTGTASVTGTFTSGAGSILRLLGNGTAGTVNGTFANGFTNNGTIELTSAGSSWGATLNVTAGTLVNPATRSIDVQAGSGGTRTLGARLDNQGTLTAGTALTLAKSTAAHVSSGTIDVTGGDLTLTLSGAGGSFTNTGTLNIGAGRTVAAVGGTFSHTAGSLGGGGGLAFSSSCTANLAVAYTAAALSLTSATVNLTPDLNTAGTVVTATGSTFNGPGTVTNPAGITLTLQGCTVNAALVNEGTLVLTGTAGMAGTFTSGAGSILRLLGNGTAGTVNGTFANGFTNNGTIELTSSGGTWGSTLNVTAGTLVNPATRSIDVQAGSGGTRTLGARLDNQGTLTAGTALTLAKSTAAHVSSGTIDVTGGDLTLTLSGAGGSFTNTGTLNIGAGRTVAAVGGTFSHTAGSLGGGGGLAFSSNCTANLAVAYTASALSLTSATVNLTPDLNTAGTVVTATGSTFNGPGTVTNPAGITLTLQGCTVNAALVNEGTLVLTGTAGMAGAFTSGAGSILRLLGNSAVGTVNGTFASGFTNNGTIELTSIGGTWGSTLNVTAGTLVNSATRSIDVQAGTGGTRTLGARLDNQGVLSAGTALTLAKSTAAHVSSGTIDVTGGDLTLTLSGAGGSFTNTGTLNIGAGRTVAAVGGTFSHTAGSLGGGGGLAFSSSCTANLAVAYTAAALSLTSATVNLTPDLNTAGTVVTATGSTFNGPGTVTNPAGITLTLQGCTVNAALVNEGTLVLTGTASVTGAFTSGAGSILRLLGNSAVGGVTGTFASGFTNNGTIELTSAGSSWGSTLNVTAGTLVNPATRSIDMQAGSGGTRTLGARLDNQGMLTVGTALTLAKSTAAHVSSGTIDVTGGDLTLTLSGAGGSFTNTGTLNIGAGRTVAAVGGTFSNEVSGTLQGNGTLNITATAFTDGGSIRPGSSPGMLRIVGAVPMVPTSQLFIEIGGTVAGSGYDRLTASGAITLDGSLDIAIVNSFTPLAGQVFPVLAGASRTGRFSGISGIPLGAGLSFEPQYSDTGLALLVVAQTWVPVVTEGPAPLARDGHTAVLDSASNRMIVFGGTTDAGPTNDVAVLTNALGGGPAQWIALAPGGTPPSARRHHTAAYDPASNAMIVFGGDDAAGTPTVFADVWVLSHANGLGGAASWSVLGAAGGPGARTGAAACYDPATKRLIVFGGSPAGSCGSDANDAWVLTNADGSAASTWTALTPSGSPPPARAFARAGYDDVGNRMVMFSGLSPCGTENLDLWALTHANGLGGTPEWISLAPTGSAPAAASLQAVAYDPVSDRLTVFGGLSGVALQGTLATIFGAGGSAGTPAWAALPASSAAPSPRSDASAVQGSNRVVLFGGMTAAGRSRAVFRLETDAGRVVDVPPTDEPAAYPTATAFTRTATPNPSTGDVRFGIAVAHPQRVEMMICDLAGRRIATLHRGSLAAGTYTFSWNGRADGGGRAPAGVYFARFDAEDARATQRVLRLR